MASGPKYGSGGEGAEHRELKEWIAKNPAATGIGWPPGKLEAPLESGDRVDILFGAEKGRCAVIEIETHASGARQGAFQAVKYRAVLCAERALPLDDPRVRAILVAWKVPPEVRMFCEKYAIEWRECRAGGNAAAAASSA